MLRRLVVVLLLGSMVGSAAACGGSVARRPTEPMLYKRPQVQYGHIKALTRQGSNYKLRFELALWLTGETGLQACIEDRVCVPGTKGLLDDVYVRDLHSLLTYRVATGAPVLMVNNRFGFRTISVNDLYGLIHGPNPYNDLFDPDIRNLGFWIETRSGRPGLNVVLGLEQQYHP
jgi:hypothetical protein